MKWSNEAIMEFLDAFEQEPIIWNRKLPEYRNRKLSEEAWSRLYNTLNWEGVTMEQMRTKKEILLASFRALVNKKKKCIRANKPFHTGWFAFEKMEKFLGPLYKIKSEGGGMDEEYGSEGETEFLDPLEGSDHMVEVITLPEKKVEKRKAAKSLENSSFQKGLHEFSNVANVQPQRVKIKDRDELDLYTELLARKLRRLNEDVREEVMLEIDTVVLRYKEAHRSSEATAEK